MKHTADHLKMLEINFIPEKMTLRLRARQDWTTE